MNLSHYRTQTRARHRALAIGALALAVAGCATETKLGGSPSVVTGGAGGATAANANSQMERCDASLGTIAIVEDQGAPWYTYFYSHYRNLGSTVPVLRMMIQQSNCFVVVERGRAMNNMMQERALAQSGEMRAGSNFGGGQIAAADFTMNPSINFNQRGGQGGSLGLGGISPGLGVIGAMAGSMRSNEASTTLIMIDNRSGVQLAAAEGSAKNFDFNFMGGAFGGLAAAGGSGYSNTPEGKIIVAAFADSYNQLVKAVKNYKAQTVRGGLGTGGTLGVQGGSTAASRELDAKPAAAPAPAPAATRRAPARRSTPQ